MEQSTYVKTDPSTNVMTAHYRHDAMRSGVHQTKGIESLKGVKWQVKTDGKVFSSPVVKNNTVYIGSEDGCFYAIHKESGEIKWKYETGGAIRSSAAVTDQFAYFTSVDGYLYALHMETGQLEWRFQTGGERFLDPWDYFLSSPIVMEGVVYFGSGDHHIYAIDANNGEVVWSYKTEMPVHASPAYVNQTIYIGGFDGYFYALNSKTGELKWKFRAIGDTWFPRGDIQGTACISDGIVYFGSRDYNLYALDAETGRGKWNFKAPGTWIITTPTVHDGIIYFGTSDYSQVYAMNSKTGEQLWSFPVHINTFGSGAVAGDSLYIGNMNGHLYSLDLKNGEKKWSFQTEASKQNSTSILNEEGKMADDLADRLRNATKVEDFIFVYDKIMELGSIVSTPHIEDGIIYFGSTDGYVYAIE